MRSPKQPTLQHHIFQQRGHTRRILLKSFACGALAVALNPLLLLLGAGEAVAAENGKKTLIVYYSRSGNTRTVANLIQKSTGADIVGLQTVDAYPEEYRAATRKAKEELESGYLPPLLTKIDNMDQYGTVIIGSPNWWGTMAGPVRTFLSQYDLSGKTVAFYITHEGSGLARSLDDLKKLCPNAKLTEGLALRGRNAASSQDDVNAWLRRIGLIK